MKSFFIALCSVVFLANLGLSQQNDYSEAWNEIEELEKKGRYKSALELVDSVFQLAWKKENTGQIIKTSFFRIKYKSYFQEDDFINAMMDLREKAPQAPEPARQVLYSALGDLYYAYYQRNRYLFIERTDVDGVLPEDIKTWTLKNIVAETFGAYKKALQNEGLLQKESIKDYSDFIELDAETERRPTLYDILAERSLSFYSDNDLSVPQNADDNFVLKDERCFTVPSIFQNIGIPVHEKYQFQGNWHAIQLFQNITRFHLTEKNTTALVDWTLRRLNYVKNEIVHEHKDTLYFEGLKAMVNNYGQVPEINEFYAELSNWYKNKAHQHDFFKNDGLGNYMKIALEKAREGKNKSGKYGKVLCSNLEKEILKKSLSISLKEVAREDRKNSFLIKYKNINQVYLKVVPYDYETYHNESINTEERIKKLNSIAPVFSEAISLTDPKDFMDHTYEHPLPKLDFGFYVLVLGTNENYEYKEDAVVFSTFQVSNLELNVKTYGAASSTLITKRGVGAPISGVEVDIYTQKYSYNSQKYVDKRVAKGNTDKDGFFSFKNDSRDYSYTKKYILSKGKDKLVLKNYNYNYNYTREFKTQSYIMTDRKIYRPGQTIHFKGIVVDHKSEEDKKLAIAKKVKVSFYDNNYQIVEEQILTTNDFGSYSGTFTAPQGVNTGRMSIQDDHGNVSFSVEEYKRPKFEVNFEPIEDEIELGEQLKVTGKAQAFAGYPLDGAKVQYRVVRRPTIPSWAYRRWGWFTPQYEQEIESGNTTTSADGTFEVSFTAKPDESIDKKFDPTFSYTIYADVTDLNGETHSSSTTARAGYRTLSVSTSMPSQVVADEKDFKLRIYTNNLNGTPVDASGGIVIQPVETPDRYLTGGNWSKPHYSFWSKSEYEKIFPEIYYGDKSDLEKIQSSVFSDVFNTANKDSSMLSLRDWNAGKYLLKAASTDKKGNKVEHEQNFQLILPDAKKPANNEVLFVHLMKSSLQPGDEAEILLSSVEKNTHVYIQFFEKDQLVKSEWKVLNAEQTKIKYPITENSRGNVTVQFYCSKFEKDFQKNTTVYVPYENKNLETKFTTFRDKLRPGETEKWTLKVTDENKDGVPAEVLASMYDASLDAFSSNYHSMNVYSNYYRTSSWSSSGFGLNSGYNYALDWNPSMEYYQLKYPNIKYFGGYSHYGYYNRRYKSMASRSEGFAGGASGEMLDEVEETSVEPQPLLDQDAPAAPAPKEKKDNSSGAYDFSSTDKPEENLQERKEQPTQIRQNFNENAFFYPHLMTNEKGEVSFEFTIPESLTEWKVIGLSHTKDLQYGSFTEKVITQKELMVVPNPPRFFREGDAMVFSSKVVNLSEEELSGNIKLSFLNPFNENDISKEFELKNAKKEFNVKAKGSTIVEWEIKIPFGQSMAAYKLVAQTKDFSDGEQQALPILSNRMLVTESLPLPVKGAGTYNFEFKKLKNNNSKSLKHHSFTLEFTNNPAWYAIQAMPYMMEYPYECAEQTFTRYYANSIATHIVNSNPKIKQVFDAWKKGSKDAFLSNLEKNQELKAVLLEETPWVLEAQDESERKKRVALLFDLNKMSHELENAFIKLEKSQKRSGGWPWFEGMPESRYITQHIVTGFGHLKALGVLSLKEDKDIRKMVLKAIGFLDGEIIRDFNRIKSAYPKYKTEKHLSSLHIHYLYGRTYFMEELPVNSQLNEAFNYFKDQAKKYWTDYGLYTQGMLALIAHRVGEKETAKDIVVSLKERALIHEEMGMYWKDNRSGYHWYQAPIETQALMIEVFDEVANDMESVEELKVWLLKNKQTNDWKTTKATAEACYALLLRGTDLLANDEMAEIKVGDTEIVYNKEIPAANQKNVKTEAGTGYFKTVWSGAEVTSKMGDISVKKSNPGVAWGAAYWQYFEDMDKITYAETNVSIQKEVFKYVNTPNGPVLKSLDKQTLVPGDKVKVRVEIRSDRDMEYVHMKDMRASGLEPVDVFSRYKYQDGLGYYQATKDAATHFFFDRLPKGTYVFEYDLKVYHKGDFSNGITTLQCMYAPEFTTHSAGIRISVEE